MSLPLASALSQPGGTSCWSCGRCLVLSLWILTVLLLSSASSSPSPSSGSSSSSSPSRSSDRHLLPAGNSIQLHKLARMVLPYVHRAAVSLDRNEEDSEEEGDLRSRLLRDHQHRHRQRPEEVRSSVDRRRMDYPLVSGQGSSGEDGGELEVVPLDLGQQDFDDTLDEQPEQKRMGFDDYGHMRFGRSHPPVKKMDDDYGHMRFGK